jgi:hypothetical protein
MHSERRSIGGRLDRLERGKTTQMETRKELWLKKAAQGISSTAELDAMIEEGLAFLTTAEQEQVIAKGQAWTEAAEAGK